MKIKMQPKMKNLIIFSLLVMPLLYQSNNSKLVQFENTQRSLSIENDDILTNSLNGTIELKLEFLGFDQDLINETAILDQLYHTYIHSSYLPLADVTFDFCFNYTSESDRANLEDYILDFASINGTDTGYELNITKLKEDLDTGVRSPDTFMLRDGLSIDAELVEEYLYTNFYEEPIDAPGYTFYIMNFTQFDNEDHTLEHWYDTYSADLDSEQPTTWWYSGYRNIEKRGAMGWGGDYRFAYIDLSSRSWYLDYVYNAWAALGGQGSELYYQYPDLDNLTQSFDFSTKGGKEILNQYIAEWINSYTGNVFQKPGRTNMPIGQSISLQVLVLENLTNNGYLPEDLDWCISETKIYDQLEADCPWIDWNIEIQWVELTNHPDLFSYIQDNLEEDSIGRFIEVSDGLFNVLEDQLSTHFNLEASEVVLPCYFFITNDIRFKWVGTSFAGLGGMGWEILLGTQNSLFDNGDTSKPLRGMSNVMIHELGHSMGLPHPHSYSYGWGSSFVKDTMSYFSAHAGFSTFYIDTIGCAHTEANYNYSQIEYIDALKLYNNHSRPSWVDDNIIEINATLAAIVTFYYQMDYNASASLAFHVRDLIEELIYEIRNPPLTPTPTPTPTPTNSTTPSTSSTVTVGITISSITAIVFIIPVIHTISKSGKYNKK